MQFIILPAWLYSCIGLTTVDLRASTKEYTMKENISSIDWGKVNDKQVYLYTLTNNNGVEIKITNYGGIVTSWITPAKNGDRQNIVLGFDNLDGYLKQNPYFGALVGRYANRIANGKFSIGDEEYTLAQNNGKNALHGGIKGFSKVVWNATVLEESIPKLHLNYLSKDGEEGYPGNLHVEVTYSLNDGNELTIEYKATTDKPTPVNLTNHSYFNLSGDHLNTILAETILINADHYTPVNNSSIPTGEIKSVKGTPFDFTAPHKIGERIKQTEGGYDHNFVLNKKEAGELTLAAIATDAQSGRKLEVYTTQPGVQFYTGNFLDGSVKDSEGKPFNKNTGFCLETQHFPDAPNQPNFPNTILQAHQKFYSRTVYKTSVAE